MLTGVAAALLFAAVQVVASEQPGSGTRRGDGPLFADFPVSKPYKGPTAKARFENAFDKKYLGPVLSAVNAEPNFAGQYRIVRFQIGGGPIGAVLMDARSGTVFRLPQDIVREDFFIYDTDCLALNKWQRSAMDEQDDSLPLSFKSTSELLIVRRCVLFGASVTRVERHYYQWHRQRWHLVRRVSLPPPPPAPIW